MWTALPFLPLSPAEGSALGSLIPGEENQTLRIGIDCGLPQGLAGTVEGASLLLLRR